MNTFFGGVVGTLVIAWVVIFFAGPKIDDVCVVAKVGMETTVIDKRGDKIEVRKGDRIVALECSEFSRAFFLRDKPNAKKLRKAVGAQ